MNTNQIEHLYRKEHVVKLIFDALGHKSFEPWYENKFIPHIEGPDDDTPSKEEILEQIAEIFKIK